MNRILSRVAVALILVGSALPSGAALAVTATAKAEVISAAEISAEQATQLLFSPVPGVLTITIPGSGGASALDLTATGVDAATGEFTFAASGGSAVAMQQLLQQLGSGPLSGSLSTGLTVSGLINGQGIQIVVREAIQNAEGGGTLKATITFD